MQRYERQIAPTRPRGGAYLSNHVGMAATGGAIAGALGGVGKTLQGVADVLDRRQDEWDAARVMEADADFIRRMTTYLDDPDNGVLSSRKLGSARGVTKQVSDDAERIAQDVAAELENDNQRQAFMARSARVALPFWKQASEHEARELRTYKDQVCQQTLSDGMEMVARDPYDSAFFDAAYNHGSAAIRARLIGADDGVVQSAVGEYCSKLEAVRISAVAEDDPIAAERMMRGSDVLSREDKIALKSRIEPAATILKTQEAVDALVNRFGPSKEREGLAWIRENKSGAEEEKLVSAYRQRVNELSIVSRSQQVSLGDVQKNNFDSLYVNTFAKGMAPDPGVVDKMLATGQISPAQHRQIVGWVSSTGGRSRAEDYLSRNDPAWDYLTPDERDHRALVHMGRSSDELKQAATQARSGVMDGSVDEARLNDLFHNGWITTSEFSKNKKLLSQINDEQKAFRSQQQELLKDDLKALKSDLFKKYGPVAKKIYDEKTVTIDFSSPSAREELVEARMETLAEVVELSGKALDESSFIRLGKVVSTDLGERFTTVQEAAKDELEAAKSYDPFGVKEERQKVEERAEAEALDKVFGDTPLFLFP